MRGIENGRLPAVPFMLQDQDTGTTYYSGLTKREMFAMAAMQGTLANPAAMVDLLTNGPSGAVATYCVQFADDLLAELAKPK